MPVESSAWPAATVVRALDCAYFLIVLSILTALVTSRVGSIGTWRRFKSSSLARQLILITLLDSWLFAYASAVLLFGVGSSLNSVACEVGIWWCVLLYASSKVMIYVFLMERLNVVHSKVKHEVTTFRDRFKSWWYRIASILLAAWIGVAITMMVGRNATLHEDGTCKIGLKIWATVPMLTLDFFVNVFLTAGFVWPVYKAGFAQAGHLVKDSCLAAVLALITSFVNILILAIMKGHQQSYICLSSCVFDVAANASILYFVTRHGGKSDTRTGIDTTMQNSHYPHNTELGPSRTACGTVPASEVHERSFIRPHTSLNISPGLLGATNKTARRSSFAPTSHLSSQFESRPYIDDEKTAVYRSTDDHEAARKPSFMEGISISRIVHSSVDSPEGLVVDSEKDAKAQESRSVQGYDAIVVNFDAVDQDDGSGKTTFTPLEEKVDITQPPKPNNNDSI